MGGAVPGPASGAPDMDGMTPFPDAPRVQGTGLTRSGTEQLLARHAPAYVLHVEAGAPAPFELLGAGRRSGIGVYDQRADASIHEPPSCEPPASPAGDCPPTVGLLSRKV